MSRTSRNNKNNLNRQTIEASHKKYNVGIYIRLSKEDGDKVESNSITNQRNKLTLYVKNQKAFELIDTYIDDGYTGTNFNRPDFSRMIDDIEQSKINCVVVKDLSRFGRDYIGVGEYLEKYFPNNSVRFIAIDDNIDSLKGSYDMMMPVRNVFNEQYAADISRKVQSAFKTKQYNGSFIGAFASYGYIKDPNDRNKLLVDEYPASIVRRIFKMYIDGMGKIAISKQLNRERILCPSAYKKLNGQKYTNGQNINDTYYWTYSTIHRMLSHEIYIGNMTQGKSHRNIKTKAKALPRDQWIVVENTHDAIIDKETWESVQVLLTKDTRQIDFNQNISMFAGFISCGDCGRAMVKNTYKLKTGELSTSYRCGTYQRYGTSFCKPHTIRHEIIEQVILEDLNEIIRRITDMQKLVDKMDKLSPNAQNNVKNEIEKVNFSLSKISKYKKGIYEDYKEGIISLAEYKTFKEDYEQQEAVYQQTIETLNRDSQSDVKKLLSQEWIKSLLKRGAITVLDRTIVTEMLDSIQIFEENKIKVVYRHDSDIAVLKVLDA